MATWAELNGQYNAKTPDTTGSSFGWAAVNQQAEEERKRREEQQRQQQAQQEKAQAEKVEENPYLPNPQVPKHPREAEADRKFQEQSVFTADTTISQAQPKKKGLLSSIASFLGFDDDFTTADTIRLQQKSAEDMKDQEIKDLAKESAGPLETLNVAAKLGVPSILQSTSAAIARKAGAEEIARKLDIRAAENKRLKQYFDQEYREFFVSDKYSVKEKMMSAPVRYVAGMIADTAPIMLSMTAAGAVGTGVATVAGAPAAAVSAVGATVSVGFGGLFSFGASYQDAREFGLEEKDAEKIGLLTAVTVAPLEFIPQFRLLSKLPGGKGIQQQVIRSYSKNIGREFTSRAVRGGTSFVRQGALEVVTEMPQTIVENAWARTYDENRELFDGVEEAGVVGFFSGGMTDVLVSATSSMYQGVRGLTEEGVVHGPNGMVIEEQAPQEIKFGEEPVEPVIPAEAPLETPVESPQSAEPTVDIGMLTQEAEKYDTEEAFIEAVQRGEVSPELYQALVDDETPSLQTRGDSPLETTIDGRKAAEVFQEYMDRHKVGAKAREYFAITDAVDTDKILGVFFGNEAGFAKKVTEFTGEHETVHAIIQNVDKIDHFKQYNRKDLLNRWRKTNKKDKSKFKPEDWKDDIFIEEQIAIEFEQYVQQRQKGAKPKSKMAEFFDSLYKLVKQMVRSYQDPSIQSFYKQIYEGRGAKQTQLKQAPNEKGFRRKIEDTPDGEVLRFTGVATNTRTGVAETFDRSIRNEKGQFIGSKQKQDTNVYQGEKDVTTNVLNKLKGRKTVSKQFISDLNKSSDLKQAERNIIQEVLAETEGNKVDVKEFANRVRSRLLPLETQSSIEGESRHENVTLEDEQRGSVAQYYENVYESPIQNSAEDAPGYFAHSRIEDLPPKGVDMDPSAMPNLTQARKGDTRRVIEIQSDLFQKGRLEGQVKQPLEAGEITTETARLADESISKLQPYRNTWHERIIREEVKKAAQDGKTNLQFPTGETAMKIEGLGETSRWDDLATESDLKVENLRVGKEITERDSYNDPASRWIITDVLGDGRFKAVPKRAFDARDTKAYPDVKSIRDADKETFDISGKVDTKNPIYKFYEKEVGKFLKNKFNAERVTDDQGVDWWQLKVDPEFADLPVPAFRMDINPETGNIQLDDATIQKLRDFYNKNVTPKRAKTSVLNEMLGSRPGERQFTQQQDTMDMKVSGQKSTFPNWVPSYLRSSKLFDQVMGDIDNGTPPRPGTKRAELYEIALSKINKRSDIKGKSPYASSRVFERLQEELPEQLQGELSYTKLNLQKDAEQAVALVAQDKQKAYQIAMGKEAVPEGQTATAINIALAEKALDEGNTELYSKLVVNRSLEQTRRGQEIVAEKGSVTDNSTARYVKELVSSRLEKLGKDYLGDIKESVGKKTRKQKATDILDREAKKVEAKIKSKKLTVTDALDLLNNHLCV